MKNQLKFKKVVIVGPGLIGGSIGLALRKHKLAHTIIGVARHKKTITKAKKRGAIDIGSHDIKKTLKGADLIVLAVPVATIKRLMREIKNDLEKDCIIFDVGSSKLEIVKIAEKVLPKNVFFVGTHPMAGSEKAGSEFAKEDLFLDALCFITRTRNTNKAALLRVKKLWDMLGARTFEIDPTVHDRIAAIVSHLPHLVSVALVDSVPKDFLKFVSTGFKDTTRVAAGDPDMWADIALSNKKAVLKAVSGFRKRLQELEKSIKRDQRGLLKQQLIRARTKRKAVH